MKTIVILSGGMDSAVLLYSTLYAGDDVRTLSFDYGQRHVKELDAAAKIADRRGVEHRSVQLDQLRGLIARGSQTGGMAVPEGHYAEESMKLTVVPNRNMIMLAIAAGHAMAIGFDRVAFGAHGGDHTIYPDCRPAFVAALSKALQLADWNPVSLVAPFLNKTKADIARLGANLGVPFDLTWSCYKGGEKHCGKCGTCVERREAFMLAGVLDPTRYE